MNGWMRLWIVISTIWAIGVAVISAIDFSDSYGEPSYYSVQSSLSQGAQEYFSIFPNAEQKPSFTVSIQFDDFSNRSFDFLLLENPTAESITQRVTSYVAGTGKGVTVGALTEFLERVMDHNDKALLAKSEFDHVRQLEMERRATYRPTAIWIAFGVATIPPVIALFLGIAVLWVRRGFSDAPRI